MNSEGRLEKRKGHGRKKGSAKEEDREDEEGEEGRERGLNEPRELIAPLLVPRPAPKSRALRAFAEEEEEAADTSEDGGRREEEKEEVSSRGRKEGKERKIDASSRTHFHQASVSRTGKPCTAERPPESIVETEPKWRASWGKAKGRLVGWRERGDLDLGSGKVQTFTFYSPSHQLDLKLLSSLLV